MRRTGMKAKQATIETMGEIKKVIISIAMVMIAVLAPVGFMEGPAGIFNTQFAYTLAIAVIISAFIALTLVPALSATFLRIGSTPRSEERRVGKECRSRW